MARKTGHNRALDTESLTSRLQLDDVSSGKELMVGLYIPSYLGVRLKARKTGHNRALNTKSLTSRYYH